MTVSSIERRILLIVCDQLGVDESDVDRETHFIDDLGADANDLVALVVALEEEFDIYVDDNEAEDIMTLKDAVRYIKERMQ